jgi:hypothetical protein
LLLSASQEENRKLVAELEVVRKESLANAQIISQITERIEEGNVATEAKETEIRADKSQIVANGNAEEEIRHLNKKVLLLKERVHVGDVVMERIAQILSVQKEPRDGTPKTIKSMEIPTLSEAADNVLGIQEAGIWRTIKGIGLNSVRTVNLGNGLTISEDVLKSMAEALKVLMIITCLLSTTISFNPFTLDKFHGSLCEFLPNQNRKSWRHVPWGCFAR